MSTTLQPDVPTVRSTRSIAELVMSLRLADAAVSMRLSCCPPANAGDVRAAQLRLRAVIAELRAIGSTSS